MIASSSTTQISSPKCQMQQARIRRPDRQTDGRHRNEFITIFHLIAGVSEAGLEEEKGESRIIPRLNIQIILCFDKLKFSSLQAP